MARTLCLVALALFAFAAVSAQNVPVTPQRNSGACAFDRVQQAIVFALRNRAELSDFSDLVNRATDIGTTQRPTEAKLTIFAPTNGALAGEIDGDIEDLPIEEVNRLVQTHITNSGAFSTKALRNDQTLQTEDPQTRLTVNVDKPGQAGANGRPLITIIGPNDPNNRATIIDPRNIKACKSFIHTIDEAITPREV